MSDILIGLDTVRVYINELFHVTKGSWKEHLTVLEEMFTRLQMAGFKVNSIKSCFGAHKFNYLGYHVTCDEVMPIWKKVEDIQALAAPKTSKFFVSLSVWSTSTVTCGKTTLTFFPINCLNFQERQMQLERRAPKVFWCYQTCDRTWIIVDLPGLQCFVWNTYWCFQNTNWRSHIPKGQAHHFLFAKDGQCPKKYTTTEKELVSVVAYLKEFRNILWGHQIVVYTYHKNIIYKKINTECVICWRLILDEFGPELKYIKSENNVVANIISYLEIGNNRDILNISELYGYNDVDLPGIDYQIRYHNIAKTQRTYDKRSLT